jgi:NhaP-type Na+/H+ or K+/H+ antiporter
MGVAMGVFGGLIIVIVMTRFEMRGPRQARAVAWFYFLWCLTGAAVSAGGSTFWTVFNAACAGYWAWVLWSGRKRKDRKPSRVLGVVADLGHRLAVHPVPVRSE